MDIYKSKAIYHILRANVKKISRLYKIEGLFYLANAMFYSMLTIFLISEKNV